MKFTIILFSLILLIPAQMVFAQESGGDVNWSEGVSIIAIVTAGMTAVGLITTQYYSHKQMKDQTNTKYLELIKGFSEKLSDLLKEGDNIDVDPDKSNESLTWTYRYLEPLDMMAYIKQNEQLPTRITGYFHVGWFGMAKSLMVWYDESVCSRNPNLRTSIQAWKFLRAYCDELDEIEEVSREEFPKALEIHFPPIPPK